VVSSWSESENNRRARFYTLTTAGRRRLGHESERWGRIALAIARALEAT
jgi:DNA-binding PadR family transcriptional regulator